MYPEGSAYPLRNLWDAAVRQHTIRLTCRCGHVRIFHGHGLWWLFERKGWPSSFNQVRRRAVCTRCLEEGRGLVRYPKLELVHEEITGGPLPLPTPGEWKKALSRHR
jgi:hypothetical protein